MILKDGALIACCIAVTTTILFGLLVIEPSFAAGDPASDYLLAQSTFLSPYDGHVPASESAALVKLLAQAADHGFHLKVAVIVTQYDLGSVPTLYNQPQRYAKFLGLEDYYYWRDELLVVMPGGYGIYKASDLPKGDVAVIGRLRKPGTADGAVLVADAERGVIALAAERGIHLSSPSASGAGSTNRTFSGNGSKTLAPITVSTGVTITWTNDGSMFGMASTDGSIEVQSTDHSGSTYVTPGQYIIRVVSDGNWTIRFPGR